MILYLYLLTLVGVQFLDNVGACCYGRCKELCDYPWSLRIPLSGKLLPSITRRCIICATLGLRTRWRVA